MPRMRPARLSWLPRGLRGSCDAGSVASSARSRRCSAARSALLARQAAAVAGRGVGNQLAAGKGKAPACRPGEAAPDDVLPVGGVQRELPDAVPSGAWAPRGLTRRETADRSLEVRPVPRRAIERFVNLRQQRSGIRWHVVCYGRYWPSNRQRYSVRRLPRASLNVSTVSACQSPMLNACETIRAPASSWLVRIGRSLRFDDDSR